MKLKTFTFTIFFIIFNLPKVVNAMQCWIVSGLDLDYNQAFSKQSELLKGNKKVGTTNCQVFGSWSDLNAYYTELTQTKQLSPSEKIFIYQGAHGDPGGDGKFNCGKENGDEINHYLSSYSQTHPVGYISDSCFSSDLQKLSLNEQKSKPKSKSIQNLCLITASPFSRVSYPRESATQFLGEASKGKNLNQILTENPLSPFSQYAGALSSAVPWYDIDADVLMTGKKIVNYTKILNQFLKKSNTCGLNESKPISLYKQNRIEFCMNRISDYINHKQQLDREYWVQGVRKSCAGYDVTQVSDAKLQNMIDDPNQFEELGNKMVVQNMFGLDGLEHSFEAESHSTANRALADYALEALKHKPKNEKDLMRWQACEKFTIE